MSELSGIPTEVLQAALQQKTVSAGKDAGIKGAFVSGFASDEAETMRYLASQLYPNEPLDKAVQRFGVKDGAIVHVADDGKLYEALPGGWSPRGMAASVAKGAGAAIPVAAGTAAGAVTLPMAATGVGLAGTMAAAGGAAAAGEAARQKIGDVMMGDASTGGINPASVVYEGVSGATGQGVGVGVNNLLTRGAVKDIARYDPAKTQSAYQQAGQYGIDITPAEATQLPTLKAQQKRLTNITATADQMDEFYKQRNTQVVGAWNQFLNHVSPAADAEDVGLLARGAARNVLKSLSDDMKAAADPWYKAAYSKNVPFTTELEDLLKRPIMRDALMKAKELFLNDPDNPITKQFALDVASDGKKIVVNRIPRMEDYDILKRGLDAILNSDAAQNKFGGMNEYGRVVTKLKNALLQQFDDPARASYIPEYAKARSIYAGGAEDLTTAMQSAMKIIADSKDTQVLSAARHIFDPRTRSPQMVAKLRTALEGEDPNAWQAVKRLYMQDVTTDALNITEQGEVFNPAGKIFKAFANPKVMENLRAAMSPQEFGRMQDMLAVFRRAASVPALRSDTEFNRLMSQEAESQARPVVAKVVRNLNPAQLFRSVDEFMTERNMDKQAERLVDLITTSDPAVIESMKELRKLSLAGQEFVLLFGHALTRGTRAGAERLVASPADKQPNYAPGGGAP